MAQLSGSSAATGAFGQRPLRWVTLAMVAGVAFALAIVFVQVSGSLVGRGTTPGAGSSSAAADASALQRHLAIEYAAGGATGGPFVDRQRQLAIEYGTTASPIDVNAALQRHLAVEYGSGSATSAAVGIDLQRHLAIEYAPTSSLDFVAAWRQHLEAEYGAR